VFQHIVKFKEAPTSLKKLIVLKSCQNKKIYLAVAKQGGKSIINLIYIKNHYEYVVLLMQ
jgi:hypothetical protein